MDFSGRTGAYWTEPEFIEVQGRKTAYRRKGEGEVVLYLHGGGNTRTWLPFHEKLSQSCDLIAAEHPGFGDSERGTLDSFSDFAIHYDEFLRILGVDKVHLVGHSLGGWLACEIASFYTGRLHSLTLFTPTGLRLVDVPSIDYLRFTPEQMFDALFNGRGERYLDQLKVFEDEVEEGVAQYEEGITANLLSWNPRYSLKLEERLQRVDVPTLVIGADEDRIVPTEMAARFAEVIPGAEFKTISDPKEPTGHLLALEKPDELVAAITSHVQSARKETQ